MGKENGRIPTITTLLEIRASNYREYLNQFGSEDAQEIFDLIDTSRPHLSQHEDVTASKYPDKESVLQSITEPKNPNKLRFAVRNEAGTLVGSINLTPDDENPTKAEIGYYLGVEHTGHGYMTEALRLLTEYAFNKLGYVELFGDVHPDNNASARVLEKAGYSHSGYADDGDLVFTNRF